MELLQNATVPDYSDSSAITTIENIGIFNHSNHLLIIEIRRWRYFATTPLEADCRGIKHACLPAGRRVNPLLYQRGKK
ncbi:MAG: hypothetical protein Q8O30_03875 [Candidatus Omnitrophota bacterium]|nr:hypothetical protein [Candidatus Omnitrophota bacterium]